MLLLGWAVPAARAADIAPGLGPVDRRAPLPLDRPPWTALVRVQTELGERCTGFLVAPQVVVTAAHCLFLPRVRRFIQPSSVHVLVGYGAGRYRAHARVARFTIPAGYQPLDEAATAGMDRAVLVLERPVVPVADAVPAAPAPAMRPVPVRLGGYGQDRDEIAVADPACRLTGQAADGQGRPLLAHDCEATRGTSGAPLLWQQPDGRWVAIGIQIAATAGRAGGIAVPLDPPAAAIPSDRSSGR